MTTDSGTNWLWEAALGTLNLLFPNRCAGCDRIDRPVLCESCRGLLEWLEPVEGCSRCGEPVDVGGGAYKALCPRCREIPPNYRQAVAALRYVGPLTRAIPSWKYAGRRDLSPVFSNLLTDWVSAKAPKWWESIDAIVPAAHHSKTIRRRGFSPPEDLAFPLGSAFSKPVLARTLFKIRFTPPQTGLTREQRVANLHESMRVFDSDLVDSRIILVVDDVMTTGATLNECARALLKAGAKRVYGLVLARQTDLSR